MPGRGRLLSSLIEGRSTSSAARAEKRAARAPQSGRFLGIYAWFQSWSTSVIGTSRPRAAAPVHNPHSFTGLLSRVDRLHLSDPACVPGNLVHAVQGWRRGGSSQSAPRRTHFTTRPARGSGRLRPIRRLPALPMRHVCGPAPRVYAGAAACGRGGHRRKCTRTETRRKSPEIVHFGGRAHSFPGGGSGSCVAALDNITQEAASAKPGAGRPTGSPPRDTGAKG